MSIIRTVALFIVLGFSGLAYAEKTPPAGSGPASAPVVQPADLPTDPPTLPSSYNQPSSASPAFDLSSSSAPAAQDQSLVEKWWFWTVVGAAVIGGILMVALIDGESSLPRTTLGNREFRP